MSTFDALIAQTFDAVFIQLMILIGINIILALGLNLITGVTGQLSMGHAGFVSIGAYTSAILVMHYHLPFAVSILGAGAMAFLVGIVIGTPTLRLEGDYLAMVTIGFGEIIRVVFLNLKITGGGLGLSGIPKFTGFTVVWVIAVLMILFNWLLLRSRTGRAMYAIREDEIAAAASGVNTTLYKVMAFAMGAFMAGVGGALYAHYMYYIHPEDFRFIKSVEILNMVVLGGMGSIPGTILGATLLTVLPEQLRFVKEYRLLFNGALLILLMTYRPNGILGDIRWYDVKRWWRERQGKDKDPSAGEGLQT